MHDKTPWFERLYDSMVHLQITVGGRILSVWSLVFFFIQVGVLFLLAIWLKRWVGRRLLSRDHFSPRARVATGTLVSYAFLALGLLVIVQTAGLDLTTFNVLAGGLGLGVGIGLQNIVSNFISGLIILFEAPIKVGDRIVVGDIEGDVVEIGARCTRVVTNDDITVLVPNSSFIGENVVNWSYGEPWVRVHIPVGVAYGTDLSLLQKVLLQVAQSHEDVLKDPPTVVRFIAFGDSALQFELRVWTSRLLHNKDILVSDLNFAIHDAFREHGIQVPFPQRVVHFPEKPDAGGTPRP